MKTLLKALVLLVAVTNTACIVRARPVVYAPVGPPPGVVMVQSVPPPERVEVMAVAPSPNHLWIRGHWAWQGGGWAWMPGHWEVRQVGHEWVPGHWQHHGNGSYWVEGHWRRF
jgi:hypothetical protein